MPTRRLGDSSQMPNNRCTHCVQTGSECTHHEVTKVRVLDIIPLAGTDVILRTWTLGEGAHDRSWLSHSPSCCFRRKYVEGLEQRLVNMEKLFERVRGAHVLSITSL